VWGLGGEKQKWKRKNIEHLTCLKKTFFVLVCVCVCTCAHLCMHSSIWLPEFEINFVVSVLPEDEWFNEICQDAIERLSGKPKAINGDRDNNSPTASVSAHSISSVRSHGSS
jgi:hypothetical protein